MTTKRFGARYGRKVKGKVAKIESNLKKKQKCPYCNKNKVKKVSYGIWYCEGCKAKFSGKAYSVSGRSALKNKDIEEGA